MIVYGKVHDRAGKYISIDFNNVDINVFIKFMSELTGTNFVVKGGSWSSSASSLRISSRHRQGPRDGNSLTGFRCVRNR